MCNHRLVVMECPNFQRDDILIDQNTGLNLIEDLTMPGFTDPDGSADTKVGNARSGQRSYRLLHKCPTSGGAAHRRGRNRPDFH